jgi:hypothetical protein
MKTYITLTVICICLISKAKAQIEFYPDIAYGVSNAKATGSYYNYTNSPITNVKSASYFHIGVLGNFKIPKSNFFISTGIIFHYYTVKYFHPSLTSGIINSSTEGSMFRGVPLILNYVVNRDKKQSLVFSAGIKYGFAAQQNTHFSLKNEISANAAIGYKFNRFYAKLFYTTSLNQLSKYPATQNIKFNAVGLSLNFKMYAGKVSKEGK